MNKIFIVLLFILLGSSLIVINNIKGNTENSFIVEYQNNKNIALPDLTNKTEILVGVYRLYNANGITIDYNVNNGYWNINGQVTNSISINLSNKVTTGLLTATLEVISNQPSDTGSSGWVFGDTQLSSGYMYFSSIYPPFTKTFNKTSVLDDLRFYISSSYEYNNFIFKLQLQKGSTATSYTVPKLIPIYKDNLSQEEKQQIGMGAFEGILQIIRTINNILKPVTDFVNGILSLFS